MVDRPAASRSRCVSPCLPCCASQDIHPFYSDLINVLFDRDHYKLALGQVNTARSIIDNVAKDYVRLLRYGDDLFRCKQLKRAALGRMVTVMRKQGPTLEYLEEVRKHLARMPAIDPSQRTLLVCGFPNVGKSSFMNKVTRAEVEVQPYAFTTKSLFVGHTDYAYHQWQVIDTPGILDHPLEERNTIEMQSITALAHLQCAVLFFMDISGHCGYTIDQQVSLFNNISPLFANKPLMIVATKTDVLPLDKLDKEDKAKVSTQHCNRCTPLLPASIPAPCAFNIWCALGAKTVAHITLAFVAQSAHSRCSMLTASPIRRPRVLDFTLTYIYTSSMCLQIDACVSKSGATFMTMSNFIDETVAAVKSKSCDILLAKRVELRMKSNKVGAVMNRLTVTEPKKRDGRQRELAIPASVLQQRAAVAASAAGGAGAGASGEEQLDADDDGMGIGPSEAGAAMVNSWLNKKMLERDRERLGGGPGVYKTDTTRYYLLRNPEWKSDIIPEIMDGKNIADFVDPDIMERLMALEAEEEGLSAAAQAEAEARGEESEEDEETAALYKEIKLKKTMAIDKHRREKGRNRPKLARRNKGLTAEELKERIAAAGLGEEAAEAAAASAAATIQPPAPRGRKRTREADSGRSGSADGDADGDAGMEDGGEGTKRQRVRSTSQGAARARSVIMADRFGGDKKAAAHAIATKTRAPSVAPAQREGLKSEAQREKNTKLVNKFRSVVFHGKQGESDRRIPDKKPKWLFAGKRGNGKTDRR